VLNPQSQLSPVWGLARSDAPGFHDWLAGLLGVEVDDVLAWDAMLHDLTPSTLAGEDAAFLFAPRLDNLCSSWSALQALIACQEDSLQATALPVVALFDHEEIGSATARGAGSSVLRVVLERIALAKDLGREDLFRAVAGSICLSADMAHAAHPNYLEKHDAEHLVHMNRGPVIKVNTSQRYASEAETEAVFQRACERAEVPFQKYAHRNDLMCGSTIGPLTAANLGMRTVDVGGAQLSMHSAREMCGAQDPDLMTRAMTAFLS
jgi:aspartyl aminopeptidase